MRANGEGADNARSRASVALDWRDMYSQIIGESTSRGLDILLAAILR